MTTLNHVLSMTQYDTPVPTKTGPTSWAWFQAECADFRDRLAVEFQTDFPTQIIQDFPDLNSWAYTPPAYPPLCNPLPVPLRHPGVPVWPPRFAPPPSPPPVPQPAPAPPLAPAARPVRYKIAMPAKYDGTPSHCLDFLAECENYFVMNPMTDAQQVRFTLQLLEKGMDMWKRTSLLALAGQPVWGLNWDNFRTHFEGRFCDKNEHRKAVHDLMSGALKQTHCYVSRFPVAIILWPYVRNSSLEPRQTLQPITSGSR